MLNHSIQSHSSAHQTLLLSHKPFLSVGGNASASSSFSIPTTSTSVSSKKSRKFPVLRRRRSSPTSVKAILTSTQKSTELKAKIVVLQTIGGALSHLTWTRPLDDISDLLGKTLLIELVAEELDSNGNEKKTVTDYARRTGSKDNEVYYEAEFNVPSDFGTIGAILVENEHHKEMFLRNVVLEGPYIGDDCDISCETWIHPKTDDQETRVFFLNKSAVPSDTPPGLRKYRERELEILRGDGTGERKTSDRIYDYDVYNDLGDPDATDQDLARPVLGGAKYPYPRRCRTGRPMTRTDPLSETRSQTPYVPRDEAFSEVKQVTFSAKTVYSVLHALVPNLKASALDTDEAFPHFTAIDTLFNEGVLLPEVESTNFLGNIIPRMVRAARDARKNVLQFETPELIDRDKFSWIRDSEFGRQTLAGLNPCCIKLVTEWPIKSSLDPNVYGPAESAITTEILQEEIGGIMTVEEAVKQKKLFILDYHDVFLPYVSKVRKLKGTTLYGSRALFFLMPKGTLRPLAIELTVPPMDGKPQWREVFVECWDATGTWLWRMAKAHVLAHDSGYHQLVSHWLRTHACTEPYIIATHRQLSAMHPIHRLLHPHCRYTMEINALARGFLINASGIIEDSFSPGKYSSEMSSVAYDLQWRFDHQALPADLISRGMAVEDPDAPHGLRLTIPDYPYANDGLLIWDAIKQWVTDFVTYYYTDDNMVKSDSELQAWWTEIRTVGHGDKKDAEWWPKLNTIDDLIGIVTIIIWVCSGHHAAVNFGQFDFAGYFPNRPTTARKPMPTEYANDEELKKFMERPEEFLLDCFPSQLQATTVMSILDVLSTHSPDEEYMGEFIMPYFKEDKIINAAFERFNGRLREIEGIIDGRNADENLKNRVGAGVVPYKLLKPFSGPGVTGQGIPNSISI